jgi:uncharacterized membrane protein
VSSNYPPPPPEEPGSEGPGPDAGAPIPPPDYTPPPVDPPPPNYPPPGSYPPPPPPGTAAYGVAGGGGYSISEAFNWGWKKFQENVGTILVAILIYFVVLAVVEVIWTLIINGVFIDSSTTTINPDTGAITTEGGSGWIAQLVVAALGALVYFLLTTIMQAGIVRGALEIANGRKPELPKMFSTEQLPQLLLAAVLVGIAAGIGALLCFFPALIVIFYTQFTVFFLIDRNLSAVDAIKASASLVNNNVGTLIGFFLASIVAYIIGAILCLVGLLVAFPVVFLAQTYTYKRLQNEAVAAV